MKKKLYIVLCGSSSVGKTTLMKPLISMLEKMHREPVVYIKEVARSLSQKGYIINKEAASSTQRLIEEEYLLRERESENAIRVADRSIIDRYSYASLNGGDSLDDAKKEILDWYDKNVVEHCRKYSHIFHIPLTDALKLDLDGIRSSDEEYRKEIDKLQRSIIEAYNIKTHTLSGSVEERLTTIKRTLESTWI